MSAGDLSLKCSCVVFSVFQVLNIIIPPVLASDFRRDAILLAMQHGWRNSGAAKLVTAMHTAVAPEGTAQNPSDIFPKHSLGARPQTRMLREICATVA